MHSDQADAIVGRDVASAMLDPLPSLRRAFLAQFKHWHPWEHCVFAGGHYWAKSVHTERDKVHTCNSDEKMFTPLRGLETSTVQTIIALNWDPPK